MREMHSRASSYLQSETECGRRAENENLNQNKNIAESPEKSMPNNDGGSEIKDDGNDSSLILIILMILISQGRADDKLLLALLYLLF